MKVRIRSLTPALLLPVLLLAAPTLAQRPETAVRPRARDLGVVIGRLPTGPGNALTDVAGIRVGQATLWEGEGVRTGVTAILPHPGEVFWDKVPGAVVVGNGFGKLAGSTQVMELGTIETPILLCGTLNVPRVADALLSWMMARPGLEGVRSINPLVGETNDGGLSDIRGRPVGEREVFAALESARPGPVEEGSVGAGTGTQALGFKGGIGTSSRLVEVSGIGTCTVGVLVQTNFGGSLQVNGAPVGAEIRRRLRAPPDPGPGADSDDGSCMIVVATDAPLEARNLRRLAARALVGLGRSGSNMSNGSGDYVIAFSTAESVRVHSRQGDRVRSGPYLGNDAVSGLFEAVMEATEEAILNSLLKAVDVTGAGGRTAHAIPLDLFIEVCRDYQVIPPAPRH
jgi:D-aminopeptidase